MDMVGGSDSGGGKGAEGTKLKKGFIFLFHDLNPLLHSFSYPKYPIISATLGSPLPPPINMRQHENLKNPKCLQEGPKLGARVWNGVYL